MPLLDPSQPPPSTTIAHAVNTSAFMSASSRVRRSANERSKERTLEAWGRTNIGRVVAIIRVGPAGWDYPDWKGIVYPKQRGRGFDALEYLAHYFRTIEINSTFYRPPPAEMARSWARRVAHRADFRFT